MFDRTEEEGTLQLWGRAGVKQVTSILSRNAFQDIIIMHIFKLEYSVISTIAHVCVHT